MCRGWGTFLLFGLFVFVLFYSDELMVRGEGQRESISK